MSFKVTKIAEIGHHLQLDVNGQNYIYRTEAWQLKTFNKIATYSLKRAFFWLKKQMKTNFVKL